MSEAFSGKDLSQKPLTGKDAARVRHMLQEVERVWPTIEAATTLVRALKYGLAIVLATSILGAALKTLGVL